MTSWRTVEIAGAGAPVSVHYLGKKALLKNKPASGRPKDLDDLRYLCQELSPDP